MEHTEAEKALALRTIMELWGQDITEDVEFTASLMELFLIGYEAGRNNGWQTKS